MRSTVDTCPRQKLRRAGKSDTAWVSRILRHFPRIFCKWYWSYLCCKYIKTLTLFVPCDFDENPSRIFHSNYIYLSCWNSPRQYVHLTMGKSPRHFYNDGFKMYLQVDKHHLSTFTLQSCWPWLSSSKGNRAKHFEQAYNFDSFPLILLLIN